MSVITDPEALRRRLLFTTCESRGHLQDWIRAYLGIDLPDCIVSEESTSSPLDFVWECYDRLRRNDIIGFSRVMAYANRGGFKTLGVSILEVMTLLHLRRNVAHMAATLEQSAASQEYVKNFFNIPLIHEYVTAQSEKQVRVVRYRHRVTGVNLSQPAWEALLDKGGYDRLENYIKIVPCTMQGANSKHVEFFVIDEVDVVPTQNVAAYHQAKGIPDARDGMLPLTVLVSTRKSRVGLVQKEIDGSVRTGLQTRHWNIIDTTEPCPASRHQPELPRQTYYVNDTEVRHVTAAAWEVLNPAEKAKFVPAEGFAGCRTCPLFAGCRGRLATHQKSRSKMLKPIADVAAKWQQSSPEFITTEFLCRKPDATGLIYPRLSREVHLKTAAEMAAMITGEPWVGPIDKAGLLALMRQRGVSFYAGMDFGFTHNFAVVTFGAFGQYAFILDCFAQPGLELDDKIQACGYLKAVYGNPQVYGDPAYPSDIKTFRRKGFRMKEWDKNAGSVKAGIEIVRALLWSGSGLVKMYFLAGDPGVEFLFDRMSKYHFKMDATGTPTEEPSEENDDECDATRYGVMNVFGSKGALKTGTAVEVLAAPALPTVPLPLPGEPQAWMQEVIRQHTGEVAEGTKLPPTSQIRKGRFSWSG